MGFITTKFFISIHFITVGVNRNQGIIITLYIQYASGLGNICKTVIQSFNTNMSFSKVSDIIRFIYSGISKFR